MYSVGIPIADAGNSKSKSNFQTHAFVSGFPFFSRYWMMYWWFENRLYVICTVINQIKLHFALRFVSSYCNMDFNCAVLKQIN